MMRRAQPWLGTLVEASVDGAAPEVAARAIDAAFAAVARVHALMSFHDPASEVARLNRAAPGEVLEVDPATAQVLGLAARVGELSGGAFDIACAPRLVEWELLPVPDGAGTAFVPGRRVLALEDGCRVRKLERGWIDLGGIAKGYAVDQAVAALLANGIGHGCVNAGGDLRVFGARAWPVAVRSPHALGMAAAQLCLRQEALATSGSYFSRRTHAGRAVSALVDGRSGNPLAAAGSVSVRAPSCAVADALTKVVLATGDTFHPALAAFGASAFMIRR
jgi:thiamine biosynthesis lipoprotein